MTLSTLKPVRFIICSRTDNPVLALFSGDMQRIISAYTAIQDEPQLFRNTSIYWKQILRLINLEDKNMYTREDFLRDYPDTNEEPSIFEWLEELSRKKQEQGIEQGIEQGKKTERLEMLMELLQRRFEAVTDDLVETLTKCTLNQLYELTNPAFDASDLDAFMAQMPELEEEDVAEEGNVTDSDKNVAD
ncbi:MAG: hypothetical protein AAF702_47000 [Chloroflexota bacterium]